VTREALRQTARERAGRRCEYCRLPDVLPQTLRFHLEHIVARQHGGPTVLENLAWSCHRCNERKGPNLTGVDPDTSTVVALFHRRRDSWDDHFQWEGLNVVGRTATGRATAWLLDMNSEERLRGRAALRRHGLF
jgi:5-methylcytosine-specific restriction endonuclease McrA